MTENKSSHVRIKLIASANLEELKALYRAGGWWDSSLDSDPGVLHRVVENSALFAGAFAGSRMVGMGRALSDLVSDAYIQDVAVLDEYRGRGIGKKIVQTLAEALKAEGVAWIGVVAEPGTDSFYRKMGFEPLQGHIPLTYRK
ncbi:MAG: GNAT family N-acetyltransferase [Desulfobacteraceae bacterium]